MEVINCDFCGSSDYIKIVEQTDILHSQSKGLFTVVSCKNCGLNFTNPRPTMAEISTFYSTYYPFFAKLTFKMFVKINFGFFIRKLANSRLALLSLICPPMSRFLATQVHPNIKDPVLVLLKSRKVNSFIDIGTGSGHYTHCWGSKSAIFNCLKYAEVFSVEPHKLSRDNLNSNGIKCWAEISEVEHNLKFDLIRMNWSLEHVHNPSKHFAFIEKRLKKDGVAIICIPNNDGLLYRLAPECLELPIHLYHFSQKDISNYAIKHNLEIISTTTFSYPEMFNFAAKIGLLKDSFLFTKNILTAQREQKYLNLTDDMGWGNDMIITLKRK